MQPQIIIKGDDTFFNNVDLLGSISLQTTLDLTGWKAEFQLQKIVIKSENITSKVFQPRFTKEQTSQFHTGSYKATLRLYDANQHLRTVFTDLPYFIDNKVEGNYV